MPQQNGVEMMLELVNSGTAIPPIVFVSAVEESRVAKASELLGAHCYVKKDDVNKDNLSHAIEEAIHQSQKIAESIA